MLDAPDVCAFVSAWLNAYARAAWLWSIQLDKASAYFARI